MPNNNNNNMGYQSVQPLMGYQNPPPPSYGMATQSNDMNSTG